MTLQSVARQYSALWRALQWDGDTPRRKEETFLLADRVRDALDRHLQTVADEAPTFVANSFTLEEMLHAGERAEVHCIRHRDLKTRFALKTLPRAHADDSVARNLLLREARLAMAVMHRHVLATRLALRLPDGRPALVTDLMHDSLADRLGTANLTLRDIETVMQGLLRGLEAVHGAGLTHCDIAPGNVLFPDAGFEHVKLADFGIALEPGETHSDLDLGFAGSPDFAAPEQLSGQLPEARSDLYACGRVLALMLDHCAGPPPSHLHAMSRALREEEPDARPQSAGDALALLAAGL